MILTFSEALDNSLDVLEANYDTNHPPLPLRDQWLYIFVSNNAPLYVGVSKQLKERIASGHSIRRFRVLADEVVARPISTRRAVEFLEACVIGLFIADGRLENKVKPQPLVPLGGWHVEERAEIEATLDELEAALLDHRPQPFDWLITHAGWYSLTTVGDFRTSRAAR